MPYPAFKEHQHNKCNDQHWNSNLELSIGHGSLEDDNGKEYQRNNNGDKASYGPFWERDTVTGNLSDSPCVHLIERVERAEVSAEYPSVHECAHR